MSAVRYIPYKEVKFLLNSESRVLTVDCPWLHVDVDIDEDQLSKTERVLVKVSSIDQNIDDGEVQEFLAFFADIPVLHTLPRKLQDNVGSGADIYDSKGTEILETVGPLDFIRKINTFSDVDAQSAFSYMPGKWEWDAQEVISASRIEGTDLCDPVSAYTALRHKRMAFQIDYAKDAHSLLAHVNMLKKNDEKKFFAVMADILSQQYYVTGQCSSCLEPAADYLPEIAEEIKSYAREEMHHDRLILKSIRTISNLPTEEFMFMPEGKLEIAAIKYAAKKCALGFAALVSILEGTVYPENDPVGKIFLDSSKPEARNGVEAHFQINKKGNHTAIPETFVGKLPPVTLSTVQIAARLTEIAIRLDSGLAGSMHRYLLSQTFDSRYEKIAA